MVKIDEVHLIDCPDCKYSSRDDYHYCRLCGHDFQEGVDESQGRFSRFVKKALSGSVSDNVRYCTNCKSEIRDFTMDFCSNCGERIPFEGYKNLCSCGNIMSNNYCNICRGKGTKKQLISDEYYLIWHNQVIIPLSEEYNTDLTKNNFKSYFNLTNEEENHIIYKMVHHVLFDKIDGNVVDFFKQVFDETKRNYKNIEESIFNLVEQEITNEFNNDGIVSSNTTTIKRSYTETVETSHIKNKHGAGTKVLATAVAGPLGFVATSGVKEETETKEVRHEGEYCHEQMIFNKENIIYQMYTRKGWGGSVFNNDHPNMNKTIIGWDSVDSIDDENFLILKTGETIKCPSWNKLEHIIKPCILNIVATANENSNKEYMNKYYDDAKNKAIEVILSLINEQIVANKKISSNSDSDVESLEKIMDMYKSGLLTDDEFVAMKQKLIGNNNESSTKFCGNCGAEIIENSKFCTQCGTQIK